MKLAVCRAKLAKIQNDRTNQSITDKQNQVRIIRGRVFFLVGVVEKELQSEKSDKNVLTK